MTHSCALDHLLAMQAKSGAFPSEVETAVGVQEDETCFVTAHVVLILSEIARDQGTSAALSHSIEQGIGFIEGCVDPELRGAFRFYPATTIGFQVQRALPPDADDTALAWMALLETGARTPDQAASDIGPLFELARTKARARGDAPWVRNGVYRTWLDSKLAINPADLCVNANILTCRAMAGLPPDPDLVQTLASARRNWASTPSGLRLLAPYYAHPDELDYAFDRAVRAGAMAALAVPDLLPNPPDDQPLYCNSHGRPIWRSPALQRARHLQRAHFQPKEIVHAPDAEVCS